MLPYAGEHSGLNSKCRVPPGVIGAEKSDAARCHYRYASTSRFATARTPWALKLMMNQRIRNDAAVAHGVRYVR